MWECGVCACVCVCSVCFTCWRGMWYVCVYVKCGVGYVCYVCLICVGEMYDECVGIYVWYMICVCHVFDVDGKDMWCEVCVGIWYVCGVCLICLWLIYDMCVSVCVWYMIYMPCDQCVCEKWVVYVWACGMICMSCVFYKYVRDV